MDVYEYLNYLLEEMPNNDYLKYPEVLDKYLPWSAELPEQCQLETNHGLGIKSIEKVLEKYDGGMKIRFTSDTFFTSVILMLEIFQSLLHAKSSFLHDVRTS